MNKKAAALMIAFSMCLTASCSTGSVTETSAESIAETSAETAAETTSGTTAETTEATTAATTAETTEETWPEDRYIPFASGNGFSLIEEGYGTEVTDQQSGTCWAHAAATALESNYLLTNGENIDVVPNDIVYATYGRIGVSDPDRDGFHAMIYSMYNVGGGPDQVMAGISNGLDGGIVLTNTMRYDNCSREEMQEALRTYGAFSIGYLDASDEYYEIYGYTTLNNHSTWSDHAVTVVGYDDDFPAEYFDPPAQSNGAWLVQNSFSERWGDGGYFWLSYETGFDEPMSLTGSYDYSYVLSYDGANTRWIVRGGTVSLANVFEYEGTLGAVGTYTADEGQEVTVRIYDGELTDGELLAEVTEEFEYPGYHTLVLDEPIEVSTFTIVAEYERSAPVEGDSRENYYGDSYIRFAGSSEPGQSYILLDGEWVDLSSEGITTVLYTDFLPNNACIKALFI